MQVPAQAHGQGQQPQAVPAAGAAFQAQGILQGLPQHLVAAAQAQHPGAPGVGLARGLGRKQYKTLAANPVYIALGRGLTFSWFAFTLLWFWSSWIQIGKLLHIISITQLLVVWLFIWFCAAVVLSLWEFLRSALLSIKVDGNPVLTHRYARMIYASVLGLAVFVFVFLLNQPAPDIVYKTF